MVHVNLAPAVHAAATVVRPYHFSSSTCGSRKQSGRRSHTQRQRQVCSGLCARPPHHGHMLIAHVCAQYVLFAWGVVFAPTARLCSGMDTLLSLMFDHSHSLKTFLQDIGCSRSVLRVLSPMYDSLSVTVSCSSARLRLSGMLDMQEHDTLWI